ncbi:PREDICTED: uncharacterized protein LOC108572127 [Habropoda laboriosa]|uniref:uncharacterized protein LOC108572127 n=1 Tax=Habropoda laboriosa TaxID=597456 RepID=UPI00083D1FD4|nr:PREDICTED: uncharacterized protein LOC108572127 [Habropoda laboriosa]
MRIKVNVLRVLLFLFVFQREEAKAAKCYQCNSKIDKDCTVNMVDIKYLKPCPTSHPFCRKAVYIYYFMNSREYITVRECVKWRNADNKCYKGRYIQDSYQLVCECKGAGCNHAVKFSSQTAILLYVFCHFVVFFSGNIT